MKTENKVIKDGNIRNIYILKKITVINVIRIKIEYLGILEIYSSIKKKKIIKQ